MCLMFGSSFGLTLMASYQLIVMYISDKYIQLILTKLLLNMGDFFYGPSGITTFLVLLVGHFLQSSTFSIL